MHLIWKRLDAPGKGDYGGYVFQRWGVVEKELWSEAIYGMLIKKIIN